MFKRMLLMLILVGIIAGGVYAWKSFQGKMIMQYMGAMSKRAQTVSTAQATKQTWQTVIQGVGTLRAVRGVDISSEVSGLVEGIYFESGDQIEVGTLLVKLRVDDEIAQLASLQAEAQLAGLTYERDYKQLQEKAVAQATVDISIANLEQAKAQVARQEAEIAKKFIRAPFAGRLGIRQIDLGQYINAGMDMVTLQALDPIYFDFYLPQGDLGKIKLGQAVTLASDNSDQKTQHIGKIWALNSKVDQSTRNVLIRAVIDNSQQDLLPGMYAVININLGETMEYITLPQTAITYNPYGNTVYVVKAAPMPIAAKDNTKQIKKDQTTKDKAATDKAATDKAATDASNQAKNDQPKSDAPKPKTPENLIVEQRFVILGPTRGDQVAIISGLKDGETVVTAGQLKLQNGSPIVINNNVMPLSESNPKPHEYE